MFRLCLLLIALIAAALLWLVAHPAQLRPLLPLTARLLPADTTIDLLEGLEIDVLGGKLDVLELEWQRNRLRIDAVRWRWDVVQIWPPELGLDVVTAGSVAIHLAQLDTPTPTDWRALPLPAETEFWPLLTRLRLAINHFSMHDADGKHLLDGHIETAPALTRGAGSIRQPDGNRLDWRWRELATGAPYSWQIDWQSSILTDATGRLQFSLQGRQLDWQLQADAATILLSGLVLDQTHLAVRGKAMPFEQLPVLLGADFELATVLPNTALGDLAVNCRGRITAGQDYSAELRGDSCNIRQGMTLGNIDVPILVVAGPALELQSFTLDAGHVTVAAFSLEAWRLSDLRLDVEPSLLWQAETGDLALPDLNYQFAVTNSQLSLSSNASGSLKGSLAGPNAHWQGILKGEFQTNFRQHEITPWQVLASVSASADDFAAEGSIDSPAHGQLASIKLSGKPTPFVYQLQADIDSDSWRWQGDLLQALLGAGQTLVPAQLTAAEFMLRLVWQGSSETSSATLSGQIRNLYGVSAGLAFAGLDVAPFSLPIRDGTLSQEISLDWQMKALNAGIAATELSGSVDRLENTWRLKDVYGNVFGGEFSIPSLKDFSSPGRQGELALTGLALDEIIGMLDMPELSVTGKIDGRIPLVWQGDTVVVPDGAMNSQGKGLIRYRPDNELTEGDSGNAQLDITRRALANLHFETLEADLDYNTNGDLTIDARMRGSNPDLDDGRPIHLNLHIENNIHSLLKSLRASEQINGWLERQLDR